MANPSVLGDDQKKFLRKRFEKWRHVQPEADLLRTMLLEIAGEEIVAPPNDFESDIEALLRSGRVFTGAPTLRIMDDNGCHRNAAQLFREAKSPRFGIGTGFGLNEGLWRQHTWAMDSNVIIETTEEREMYFGITLFEADAQAFCDRLA